MFFRFTTLQEANAFLPLVKERFAQIHTLVAEGQLLHDALPVEKEIQDSIGITLEDQKIDSARVYEIEQLIKNEVVQLNQLGAIVKSVFPPRVDFLAKRHEQPVYLSWQMGEKKIKTWRPIDEEFAFRRHIQNPDLFGPFVVH